MRQPARLVVFLATLLTPLSLSCAQTRGPDTLVRHEFFSITIPGTPADERGTGDNPDRCWTIHTESATPIGVLIDRHSDLPQVSSACIAAEGGTRTLASETDRAIASFTKIFGVSGGGGEIVTRVTSIESSGTPGNELRLEEKRRGFVLRVRVFVAANVGIAVSVLGSGDQVYGKRATAFLDSLTLSERFREPVRR